MTHVHAAAAKNIKNAAEWINNFPGGINLWFVQSAEAIMSI